MKKWRGWVSRLLPILIISIALGGAGYSWNARALGNNAVPMPFGVGLSVVLSGSMEPALHVNDLAVIRPSDSYEPGDIIVYQTGNSAVIHRLIETDGTTAVTKGDANNVADEPIPTYSIKGKLVRVIPKAGLAIQILQSAPFTAAVVLLGGWFLIRSHRSERAEAAAETDQIREEIEKLKAEMLAAEEKKEDP